MIREAVGAGSLLCLILVITPTQRASEHIYRKKSNDVCAEASLFDLAVEHIKTCEGLHDERHYPYVGYGHKVLPGEHFPAALCEPAADSLLRRDLLHRCAVFRSFGADSLLLGVLAYNVGEGAVLRSCLIKKLKAGDRDIYHEFTSFRMYRGKVLPSLQRRREKEYELLFETL